MERDFMEWLGITSDAVEGCLSPLIEVGLREVPESIENPLDSHTEPHRGIYEEEVVRYPKIEKQKASAEKARQLYVTLQDNIHRGGQLKAEISKGIYEGKEPYDLLLQALECISLMTGDNMYYTENRDKLSEIYSVTGNQRAIEQEIQAVTDRLSKMEEYQNREPSPSVRRAIEQHRKRLSELNNQA